MTEHPAHEARGGRLARWRPALFPALAVVTALVAAALAVAAGLGFWDPPGWLVTYWLAVISCTGAVAALAGSGRHGR